jgi:hypothetical protein
MARRSVFTNTSQDRAYDRLAESLLQRCERTPGRTGWLAIAHLLPDVRVVTHLDDAERGELLGAWYALLEEAGLRLEACFHRTGIDVDAMVVHRGDDSSSWNAAAGAWNKARSGWIQLVRLLGQEALLEAFCPGKVLRLMAADVAAWHRHSGGGLHPDTFVWRDLPLPWQVLRGQATCTRRDVVAACRRHGVDWRSWVGEAPPRKPAPFRPTPELVHGVAVSSPSLARALRKAGAFSGKGLRGPLPLAVVERDAHGFAVEAREA